MVQMSEELHESGTAHYSDVPCVAVSLASTRLVWSDRTVPQLYPLQLAAPQLCPLQLLPLKCVCLLRITHSHKSWHALVVTHHMRNGSRLSPSLLVTMIIVSRESLGTRLLKKHYWRLLDTGGVTPIDSIVTAASTGQNFEKLFSVIWQLTTLIFGALTTDHIAFQLDYALLISNVDH